MIKTKKTLLTLSILSLLLVSGCTSGRKTNEVKVVSKKEQASEYSLSIYGTNRININQYSDDDELDTFLDKTSYSPSSSDTYKEKKSSPNEKSKKPVLNKKEQTVKFDWDKLLDEDKKSLSPNQKKNILAQDKYKKEIVNKLQKELDTKRKQKEIVGEDDGADLRATPVFLQVIQLHDKSLFLNSTYEDFSNKDLKDSLGTTYLTHKDYVINPNQFRFIPVQKLNKDTYFIGIVAYFNDYSDRKWRALVRVTPKGGNQHPLLVRISESRVDIYKD